MGELRLPGLSTGIDTSALIKQLMAVERRTLNLYTKRQDTWNDRKDALTELKNRLDDLRSSMKALSDSSELRAYATASSDTDLVTAEASHNAFEGNHSVVVNQLANAERWVHTGGLEYAESLVGAGTFIYSYNNQEMVLTTTADTTLEDLVGLINNDAKNPGVTANLLFYNDAYHLMLNGNDAGSDYEILINASNTEVWQTASPLTLGSENAALADKIKDLDQFSGVFAGDETITITGLRHDGTAVNQSIAVNENTTLDHVIQEIDDAFGGTATATLVNGQIRLTSNTSGASQMQLSLAYNAGTGATTLALPAIAQSTQGGSVAANLAGFAAANFSETQSAQDSQIKVDGYPQGAGEWITRSSNTIDDVIHGVTLHLHDTGTVQVNLTRDIQSVKEKIDSMVTAYNAAVTFLKEKTGYNDVLKTAGLLMGDLTISNIVNDLRSPLIQQTSGFVVDVESFLMPGQIGLELDSDGMLSLNGSDFDEAIAEDYMGVLALIGADKTGSSDSNKIEFYGASSDSTTAGTYQVEVTIAGGVITSARMKLESDSTWRNAGFNENVVMGDSTFNDDNLPINPENGLQLGVDLSQDGTFTATVRVKQGFTGAMEDTLDRILQATTGALALDQEHVDAQIEHLQTQMDTEEGRLTQREAFLVSKFARLEKTLTLLQSQTAALGLSG
jgi:flagellar hook-associated protein 2